MCVRVYTFDPDAMNSVAFFFSNTIFERTGNFVDN